MKTRRSPHALFAAALCCGSLFCASSVHAATLEEALDAPQLTWTTGGDAPWFGQAVTTHDGVDAGECGGLTNNWGES